MKKVHVSKQITTSATIPFINGSSYLAQISYCCTIDGTTWVMAVQDRGSPIKTLIKVALSSTTTPDQEKVFFDELMQMIGGVDVVTTGTPGTVQVWITGYVSEEGT